MNNYETLMRRCFELARLGEGKVSPNPLVGCVVLNRDGEIVSEGYHHKYGENHAERDALLKIQNGEERGGTVVVNLEPCSHFGKTPPCTDLIIERGVARVVFAMRDVNPKVDGVRKLQDAGIEVISGVLEDEARKLNEVFIKNMIEHKTFVAIKTATTLDGKIATSSGSSKWITSESAREEVKVIRNRYDAILTSSSTVIADNPTMAHRKKVLLDRNLRTDINSRFFHDGEIYVFCSGKSGTLKNITYIDTPVVSGKLDLEFVLNKLYEFGINSVLVEAGGHLNGSFLPFADKIYHFIAPKITNDNSSLSAFDGAIIDDINKSELFKIDSVSMFPPDVLLTYYPMDNK